MDHQASLSIGFPRQDYWSRLPFPFPGDLPDPWIELGSPALQVDFLGTQLPGKPTNQPYVDIKIIYKFKIHFLHCTSHISTVQEPYMAYDYLLDSAGIGHTHCHRKFNWMALGWTFGESHKNPISQGLLAVFSNQTIQNRHFTLHLTSMFIV